MSEKQINVKMLIPSPYLVANMTGDNTVFAFSVREILYILENGEYKPISFDKVSEIIENLVSPECYFITDSSEAKKIIESLYVRADGHLYSLYEYCINAILETITGIIRAQNMDLVPEAGYDSFLKATYLCAESYVEGNDNAIYVSLAVQFLLSALFNFAMPIEIINAQMEQDLEKVSLIKHDNENDDERENSKFMN